MSADLLRTSSRCATISAFTKYTTRENSEQLLSEDVFLLHQMRGHPAQEQRDFFGGFVGVTPRVVAHGANSCCMYGLVYLRSSSARRNVQVNQWPLPSQHNSRPPPFSPMPSTTVVKTFVRLNLPPRRSVSASAPPHRHR